MASLGIFRLSACAVKAVMFFLHMQLFKLMKCFQINRKHFLKNIILITIGSAEIVVLGWSAALETQKSVIFLW